MKVSYQTPEPTTHDSHQASQCDSNVPGGPGGGTAALEVKLLQQLMGMREEILLEVILDLQKAYDSLDQ